MEIEQAKRVLQIEADAIHDLVERIGDDFLKALGLVETCPGKIVVTGMGKSGLVGRKIAATFAGTGAPAFFLHPAEAVHGDLGMIGKGDVVIALSKSGETKEIIDLLPVFKRRGLKIIALTGATESTLGKAADAVLDVSVKEEACPLNLAPTASTTAALAMGDALAITLFKKRGYTEEDFAALHPGGALGKRLLRVRDLMRTGEDVPLVKEGESSENTMLEMSAKRLGHTGVIDPDGRLVGIVADGDLRRLFNKHGGLAGLTARDMMSENPKRILAEAIAARAVQVMEDHSITALFIVDDRERPEGIIHLHDILKSGAI